MSIRDRLMGMTLCACGHSAHAHTGHTTMVGREPSTHCACCSKCREYRPNPANVVDMVERIEEEYYARMERNEE